MDLSMIINKDTNPVNTKDVGKRGFDYKILTYDVLAVRDNVLIGREKTGAKNIYKSDDYGETWVLKGATVANISMAHVTSTGVLLVFCSDDTLYKSTDYGVTLVQVATDVRAPLLNGIDSAGNTIIYGEYTTDVADALVRIMKSTDAGATWTAVKTIAFAPDIRHFHTVRYLRQWSMWIATNGDVTAEIFASIDGTTWALSGVGNQYRTVGVAEVPSRTLLWAADTANKAFIYAGNIDKMDATTRPIGIVDGHVLGMAGERNTIMIVTRVETSDAQGHSLNPIYVSYDGGRSFQIEEYLTSSTPSGGSARGLIGPDKKGNFYVNFIGTEEGGSANYVTVKCTKKKTPMVIEGISGSYSQRTFKFDILSANQIRQNTSTTYGTPLPFTIFNPVIFVQNTLDVDAKFRIKNATMGGFYRDGSGAEISPNLPKDAALTQILTPTELKMSTIPEGTSIGAFCSVAPTSGALTMIIHGTVFMPDDHRLLG